MRMQLRTRRDRPAGFTLIELLVVIAIIAVLVSLTAAAVMKVLGKGPLVRTRVEIGNMEAALGIAMKTLNNGSSGATYLPSKIVLREDGKYTPATNPAHAQTVQVLTNLFGKGAVNLTTPVQIDWNGDGVINTGVEYTLEGEECLVFFMGGIPSAPGSTPACLGFVKGSNPSPVPVPATATRYVPFFPFDGARLIRSPRAGAPANFLVYKDPYGKTAYAYFSWYGAGNDYVLTDCASLGVQPYYTKSGTAASFFNPRGCQIISAGADGTFGVGGVWDPIKGYGGTGVGNDDMSNFSKNLLGVGTN